MGYWIDVSSAVPYNAPRNSCGERIKIWRKFHQTVQFFFLHRSKNTRTFISDLETDDDSRSSADFFVHELNLTEEEI